MCYGTLVYLYFHDPALLKERFGSPDTGNTEALGQDTAVAVFVEFIVWWSIMPLDARRFRWSPAFPFWTKAIGTLLLILAVYIVFEALKENTFAAPW